MNPKKQILRFVQKAYEEASRAESSGDEKTPADRSSQNGVIREIFDGMSTGTARIIIEKEMDQDLSEDYQIDHLTNKGRYYLAKIVRSDGRPIQRLLVDKQTGNVQMVGR